MIRARCFNLVYKVHSVAR